jgi:hypothetical protein
MMKGLSLAALRSVEGWRCVQDVCAATQVETGFTSDLLSDIMANAPAHSALVTLQAHLNTLAVASLAGVHAVILTSGREAPPDMLAAARREGILLLQTNDNQYQASIKLDAAFRSVSGGS